MSAKILVLDGNTPEGNAKIVSAGGQAYGEGYAEALRLFVPGLHITILRVTTGEPLPAGVALEDFDGIAWTGSPLSAYHDQPEVTRQIEIAKAVHSSGVPCFGSCWGQQIMCQALGGEVRANPKGIEIGVAKHISPTEAGKQHKMFDGKPSPFDALAIHRDEVVTLPPGAVVLAENEMSAIQAMELSGDHGNLWAVQYHPEFTFALLALLFRRDADILVRDGRCRSHEEVQETIDDFEALHADPNDASLAAKHEVGDDVLNPRLRMAEFQNWLDIKVRPRAAARL